MAIPRPVSVSKPPVNTASLAFTPPASSSSGYTGITASSPPAAQTPSIGQTVFGTPAPQASATSQSPLQNPGNNMVNPGYDEQALLYTQNQLLNDPSQGLLQQSYQGAQQPQRGEQYLNQNLGTLQGPGQGDQYWNQVQGQFRDPYAGEQFTRNASQNLSPTGPAGAFAGRAMGEYDNMVGYQGPGALAGQYGANAASGPLAGQSFYDQVGGTFDQRGTYSDPNLSAGQYAQTQGAFGELPIAEFDPFYDRARQLATQDYNRQSAGRGVYGSSEALSGVGNVITDIEAQRANRSFDAEMQRAQEQRARQQLLGEQARMGDLSSLGAFNANMQGLQTYGNLAATAGQQTLGQQTMLGQQAQGVDQQALNEQAERRAGMSALGDIEAEAGRQETDRFRATTGAMNEADRTQNERLRTGADIAFRGDENARADYTAEANAAQASGQLEQNRERFGSDVAQQMSQNQLNRTESFNRAAAGAEINRQNRQVQKMADDFKFNDAVQSALSEAAGNAAKYGADEFENWFKSEIAPSIQDAQLSAANKEQIRRDMKALFDEAHGFAQDLED